MRGFETTVHMSFADTEQAVRDALGRVGFGVVSEIDVAANLNRALGGDRAPLKILGACSPVLADRALDIDPSVALLLPCNVALDEHQGGIRVRIVDPRDLIDDPRFEALADDAAAQLQAALDELPVGAP